MNVWEVYNSLNNGYYYLDVDEKEYFDIFQFNIFDGNPLLNQWTPVHAELKREAVNGKALLPTDMPYLGKGYFAVQDRFLSKWDAICKGSYEKLRLLSEDGDFSLINITNVIDCLDLKNMNYKVYKGNKTRIQKVDKFIFVKKQIENEVVFKIQNYSIGHIFCTDIFKNQMEKEGIKGLHYEKVWSDTDG